MGSAADRANHTWIDRGAVIVSNFDAVKNNDLLMDWMRARHEYLQHKAKLDPRASSYGARLMVADLERNAEIKETIWLAYQAEHDMF